MTSERVITTSILIWNHVEHSLPPDDLAVLCDDRKTIWLGYREAGKWYSVDASEWPEVKYWAELPATGS